MAVSTEPNAKFVTSQQLIVQTKACHVAPSRDKSRHHPSAVPISDFHLTIDVKVGVRHSPNGEEADASDRGKGQAQAQGLVFGLWQWINEKSKESCS
jgi:hypothetical protein